MKKSWFCKEEALALQKKLSKTPTEVSESNQDIYGWRHPGHVQAAKDAGGTCFKQLQRILKDVIALGFQEIMMKNPEHPSVQSVPDIVESLHLCMGKDGVSLMYRL